MEINEFDRFMAVSHFDEEMAEAHTPTEDAIHNWIVDNQEDDELIAGILKHLDRTIKDAMAYCIRKASKEMVKVLWLMMPQSFLGLKSILPLRRLRQNQL